MIKPPYAEYRHPGSFRLMPNIVYIESQHPSAPVDKNTGQIVQKNEPQFKPEAHSSSVSEDQVCRDKRCAAHRPFGRERPGISSTGPGAAESAPQGKQSDDTRHDALRSTSAPFQYNPVQSEGSCRRTNPPVWPLEPARSGLGHCP